MGGHQRARRESTGEQRVDGSDDPVDAGTHAYTIQQVGFLLGIDNTGAGGKTKIETILGCSCIYSTMHHPEM